MSITDELREWTRNHTVNCSDDRIALVAIADRIDAEHERAVDAFERDMGMEAMTDENMAKHGWVRLPVDADGVPIHAGETMLERSGNTFEVGALLFYSSQNWLVLQNPRNYSTLRIPDQIRHYTQPTVEGILRDFGVDIAHALDADPDATVPEAVIAEYAAKLRLAGEGE